MSDERSERVLDAARAIAGALDTWDEVEEAAVMLSLGLRLASAHFRAQHPLAPLSSAQINARRVLEDVASDLAQRHDLEMK